MAPADTVRRLSALCLVATCSASVIGQWSADPALNLAIADRSEDQLLPKIHGTSDGGCYVSWMDDCDGGFDVYLQRLDANGNEMWTHNGILVADRSASMVLRYGLDVDAFDNALLGFLDDRFGGLQVTAAKVNPEGELLWGPDGVQVSSPGYDSESVGIAAATDGHVVVAWTAVFSTYTDVRLQKLNGDGVPQWESPLVYCPDGASYHLADLHAADDGAVIISLVKDGPMYWSPRHLHAQKVAPTGGGMWGDTPLVLFDDGSMPYGCFPEFVPDGGGGAAFTWPRTDPPHDCYGQHVLADGTRAFGHEGVFVTTLATRQHLLPRVSFDPGLGTTFVTWIDYCPVEDSYAVCGQKLNALGVRQWGDHGLELCALAPAEIPELAQFPQENGLTVFWAEGVGFEQYELKAKRVDGSGEAMWEPAVVTFCTVASHKSGLRVAGGAAECALLAWMDNRAGARDVYGQNVNADGSLGGGGGGGCGDPEAGDCCEASWTPYCDDLACCESVCSYAPWCCGDEGWDPFCVELALEDPNCPCGQQVGACCDPFTAICTDDTSAGECLPPLQFHSDAFCESLEPPCGNVGACCDDLAEGGYCEDGVLEVFCEGTRFLGGGTCEDFEPPCGAAAPLTIVFLDPPTAAPPGELCECELTTFGDDPRPVYEEVESVSSPCPVGGEVLFSIPMVHHEVPETWWTWSHGYAGDVYQTTAFSNEVTLTLPPGTCGFYFYVQPSEWAWFDFEVTVNGVVTTEPFGVHGDGGATFVGVCGVDLQTIRVVCLGDAFAVGEFGICCSCEPVFGACCDPASGECLDEALASECYPPLEFWAGAVCEGLDPPCGNPGACCDPYTGMCEDGVLEVGCVAGLRFEGGVLCADLAPACGTPGCCCLDSEVTLWVELEAVCLSLGGRFIAGLDEAGCVAEAFAPACGEWACRGILYAPTKNDNPAWRADVAQRCGCRVDYWDARLGTPTLLVLREYCCVFTWVDYPYADAEGMGDVLADYVDTGGKVVLGQWAVPTIQGNWLAGRIMTAAYCPVTAETYLPGTYAGDGTDCAWCGVEVLDCEYVDRCTLVAGAESDGTLVDGYLALAWRSDRAVTYSPGNTGHAYLAGDTAQLLANICACAGPVAVGACCDPYTGVCVDEAACGECAGASLYFVGQTCAGLDPPCGNPGCCCDAETGQTTYGLAAACVGRFLPGIPEEECSAEAFDPLCGEYEACEHALTMWDDFGDGWNDGYIDVYVNGAAVLVGVTLGSGSGPETVTFAAATGDEITTDWTPGGWQNEVSYCIYDGLGGELGCDGLGGAAPTGLTVMAACEEAVCGDGICAASEDCCSCPEDCGAYGCLTQLPKQENGVDSDLHCSGCEYGMQIVAENFRVCEESLEQIEGLVFWGGYRPTGASVDPDAFTVVFYVDDGGAPGGVVATFGPMPATTKAATGESVVGVDEYQYTVDLEPDLSLEGGTYWVAVYNNTTETTDTWFWETGALDECAGIHGGMLAFELPEWWFPLYPPGDLALDIICAAGFPIGDVNCDGNVNFFDIDAFVQALTDPEGYGAAYPDCDLMLADCSGDGLVNFFDIDAFVALITGGE